MLHDYIYIVIYFSRQVSQSYLSFHLPVLMLEPPESMLLHIVQGFRQSSGEVPSPHRGHVDTMQSPG